jgi:hypothetical protein
VDAAWSAPSAIGTAGLGVGTQAGAEMTDFLIVLNSHSVSSWHTAHVFGEADTHTLAGNCKEPRLLGLVIPTDLRLEIIYGRWVPHAGREPQHCFGSSRSQWRSSWITQHKWKTLCNVCPLSYLDPLSFTDSHHFPVIRYSYSKTKGLFGGSPPRDHLWR